MSTDTDTVREALMYVSSPASSRRHQDAAIAALDRLAAAEAQRDTLAEALREIAAMTAPQWEIGSARHRARAALAAVTPAVPALADFEARP